jgi:hypothetical protein
VVVVVVVLSVVVWVEPVLDDSPGDVAPELAPPAQPTKTITRTAVKQQPDTRLNMVALL